MNAKVRLTRELTIRAMHKLENPKLSAAENEKLYGSCSRHHGHDYRIQVTLEGVPDEKTGLLFDRDRLERILKTAVIEPFDGSDLNALFPNTAGEALARALYLRLRPLFPDAMLVCIGVRETEKNYFVFPAEFAM